MPILIVMTDIFKSWKYNSQSEIQ